MNVTEEHLEICKRYARNEINYQQTKFLLVSNNLTEEEAEELMDRFMNYVFLIKDLFKLGALLILLSMIGCLLFVSILRIL